MNIVGFFNSMFHWKTVGGIKKAPAKKESTQEAAARALQEMIHRTTKR